MTPLTDVFRIQAIIHNLNILITMNVRPMTWLLGNNMWLLSDKVEVTFSAFIALKNTIKFMN